MKLESFTLLDLVLEKGEISIEEERCLEIPKEVYSGHIVVRRIKKEGYYLSINILLEQEIQRILNSSLTNKIRRVYQISGTREPYIIERMLERIKDIQYPHMIDSSQAWEVLLKTGKYIETTPQFSPSLDFLIYHKILEYECEGYYSPHIGWINQIKKNHIISFNKAGEIIKCNNPETINNWMISLGYILENNKYVLSEEERLDSPVFSDNMIDEEIYINN